jgi:hypothetical protein
MVTVNMNSDTATGGPKLLIVAHERGKNFLNDAEMEKLLEAAKRGRFRTTLYITPLRRSFWTLKKARCHIGSG